MIIPILALSLLAQASHPAKQITIFGNSADRLVKNCREVVHIDKGEDGNEVSAQSCLHYLEGVYDGQSFAAGMNGGKYPVCLDSEVDIVQMAKVVVKYGDEHPEELHELAIKLVNDALKAAYPCH
jgi:hypothetical protein